MLSTGKNHERSSKSTFDDYRGVLSTSEHKFEINHGDNLSERLSRSYKRLNSENEFLTIFLPRFDMHFQQVVQLPHRLRTAFRLFSSRLNEISNKIRNYEMPERVKGTFLERWAKYWHGLYIDYKDVAFDVAKDCREHPVRTAVYTTFLGGCFYSSRHNPDEIKFRQQLIQSSIMLIQVGEPIRNPVSVQHIKWLEQCYNEGLIRRLNLGILSLIWLDNFDKDCSLYKAVCPYLKPRYVTFYERIVDVGFLDRWWLLEKKMVDYDINEAEFNIVKTANDTGTVSAT